MIVYKNGVKNLRSVVREFWNYRAMKRDNMGD